MFVVGPYLFSGEELDIYLKGRKAAALEAVRDAEKAANTSGADAVRAIYDQFSIADTKLHADRAHFTEERPLNAEECEAIGAREEDRDKHKAITIAIPFSGDEHLLTDRPTIYSAHQPQADIRDGALHLTWFLNEIEEHQLENNFKRQIALIERTLEVTQWQAMACNQEMMTELREALEV